MKINKYEWETHYVGLCPVTGKKKYSHKTYAKKSHAKRHDNSLRPYKCSECDAWHLGHRRRQYRRQDQAIADRHTSHTIATYPEDYDLELVDMLTAQSATIGLWRDRSGHLLYGVDQCPRYRDAFVGYDTEDLRRLYDSAQAVFLLDEYCPEVSEKDRDWFVMVTEEALNARPA